MNNDMKYLPPRRGSGAAFLCAPFLLLLLLLTASSFGAPPSPSQSSPEAIRLGERIYREGILPSGEPLRVTLTAEASAPGTTFACVSCHLRSGLGSVAEVTVIPPITGTRLFTPFKAYSTPDYVRRQNIPRPIIEETLKYYPKPPKRPLYTDASLAEAIRSGKDPAGRILNSAMPRYTLKDDEMKFLIAYLKSLSGGSSPGVSDTTIRFATIITDDVSPEARNAMLFPLENYVNIRNQTIFADQTPSLTGYRSRLMAEATLTPKGVGARKLSLSRWVLKGAPESWRGQLEKYYREEPVFALLGGVTGGEWRPIHQFCEENRIPCIFPNTDFPVISHTDWYTLYLSKGYYREGEAAARFLTEIVETDGNPVVQIVRDTREGRALSEGFQEAWRDFGHKEPVTIILENGKASDRLEREMAREKPPIILLWDGPNSLNILEKLAAGKKRPAMALVSSSFLGTSLFSMNDQARAFTYITYPYAMPQKPVDPTIPWLGTNNFNAEANAVPATRIAQQTYILTLVLNMALLNMRGEYYRDNLLDVIGTIMDQDVPLYQRLSFGPGQRYIARGCYIVQLAENGRLKKNSWVTP